MNSGGYLWERRRAASFLSTHSTPVCSSLNTILVRSGTVTLANLSTLVFNNVVMDNPKAAEQIAGAFYDWLWAEFISSGEGRNKYLDAKDKNPEIAQKKFDDFRGRLSLPYDNDDNWAAHKDRGHQQQRVPMWVDTFEETSGGDPKADFYAAQAMFAPFS
jgi:hypothetical protein